MNPLNVSSYSGFHRYLLTASVLCLSLGPAGHARAQTRIDDTPSLIQDGFGPGGFDLRGDGTEYCGPTMANIMLGYLAKQGFTQIMPENPTTADYLNTERILIGLSDASYTSGALWSNVSNAMTMVVNAAGIQNFTIQDPEAPTLDFFSNAQADRYTATGLNVQWLQRTTPTGNVYNDIGGHFIGVSGVNTVTGELVISNPMPSSLFYVADVPSQNPQYTETIAFDGTSSGLDPGTYLQFNYNQANSALSNTTNGDIAVIAAGYSATIDAGELPVSGWTPATWTLTDATNDFTFNGATLNVKAPLAGSVGIEKDGSGVVILHGANNTTGANTLTAGTVKSLSAGSTPLGTGSITMLHSTIELTPDDSIPADIVQTLAGGTGSGLTYSGGGHLLLDAGGNTSLTVNIGDATRAKVQNFVRTGTGTFVLQLANGIANLGTSTQVHVQGFGSLPLTHGILAPYLIGADTDASGTFLTYDSSGFARAGYTSSTSVGIGSTDASTVYDAVSNQTVAAGTTASVYALRVASGMNVSGGDSASELQVGSQDAGTEGGVILNHGAQIGVASLQFGSANALIYTGGANNAIHSNITAANLTKFGTGELTLDGTNNLSGSLNIQSGTVRLAGTGSPSGAAPVALGAATLIVANGTVVQGAIDSHSGTIRLAGGTVGTVTTDGNSTLTGNGTVSGTATLNGVVSPGLNNLVFEGAVTMNSNSMLVFTLGSLTDSTTGGVAGQNWSLITLEHSGGTQATLSGFSFENDFDLIAGSLPNGTDPFWNTDHSWLFIQSTEAFNADFNEFSPSWGFPAYEQGSFEWTTAFVSGATYEHQLSMNFYAVPEPSTYILLTLGLAGIIGLRWRARTKIKARAWPLENLPVSL